MESYGRFAEVYDRLMSDVDYDAWAAYLGALMNRFLPDHAERTIHECACGTGLLTARLSKLGYAVSASDVSADMLRVAQEKAMRQGMRIPLIQQDMRALQLHKPVDAVVAACDGVNYLLNDAELTEFFCAAARNLKPGGVLLFDCSTEYKLSEVLGYRTFGEDDGDVAYLWKNAYDETNRLIEMRISFFIKRGRSYERFTERHVQRAHRPEEIRTALEKAGFRGMESFEAFSFKPGNDASERVQWAARREV